MRVKCGNPNCQKAFSVGDFMSDSFPEGWFGIFDNIVIDTVICSPSCLVEFAWWLKENQTKLSKSASAVADPSNKS